MAIEEEIILPIERLHEDAVLDRFNERPPGHRRRIHSCL